MAWTSRPPAGTEIDWTNPLTSGLGVCIPANEGTGLPNNVVTGLAPSLVVGGGTLTWGASGIDLAYSGTATNPYLEYLGTLSDAFKNEFMGCGTVVTVQINLGATSGDQSTLLLGNGATGGRRWLVMAGTTAEYSKYASMYTYSGGNNYFESSTTTISRNVEHTLASTFGATASTGKTYLDGGTPTNFTALTSWSTAALTQFRLQGNATHVVFLAWNRILSDAEVSSICANPWQVFVSGSSGISGSSGVTLEGALSDSAGKLLLSGAGAVLLDGVINNAAGTLMITGVSSTTLADVISNSSGTLVTIPDILVASSVALDGVLGTSTGSIVTLQTLTGRLWVKRAGIWHPVLLV